MRHKYWIEGKSKANTFSLWRRRGDGLYCSINSYNMGEGRMIRVWFSVPAFQDPPWFYLLFCPWVTTVFTNIYGKDTSHIHLSLTSSKLVSSLAVIPLMESNLKAGQKSLNPKSCSGLHYTLTRPAQRQECLLDPKDQLCLLSSDTNNVT